MTFGWKKPRILVDFSGENETARQRIHYAAGINPGGRFR
jgi:hypothetical protein